VTDLFTRIKEPVISLLEKELDPRLGYHNVAHTLDVLHQAVVIAKEEEIKDEHELLLIKTAAVFHDTGFLQVYKGHEEKGCEIAEAFLKNLLGKEDIAMICGMIMATKIPQSPKNLFEKIICDADLDYLGRDDFEPISQRLYREFISFNIIPADAVWNKVQVGFFESHHYFTATSQKKRAAKKSEHLQKLKHRLDQQI
jgi:predicted metal-dependent HD superfamily phosphohydrolase